MAVFIAILTMLGTVGNYGLYLRKMLPEPVLIGIKAALFIIAFIAMCAYRGPKTYRPVWHRWYPLLTLRFSIILLSLLINIGLLLGIVLKWR